jgi:hypothetical protein
MRRDRTLDHCPRPILCAPDASGCVQRHERAIATQKLPGQENRVSRGSHKSRTLPVSP